MAYVSLTQKKKKKKNLNYGAGKMAQWVKKLADKTDDLVPSSETVWTKEKPDSWKLFSDLHTLFCSTYENTHVHIYK